MRMMAPDGTLGEVPMDGIDAAKAAGFRLMTPDDLRAMYNQTFMEHSLFEEKQRKIFQKFQPKHRTRVRRRRA